MRVISFDSAEAIKRELEGIGVDDRALPIFAGKSQTVAFKLYRLTCAQANVLKQTALAIGADCAIHRDVIKGAVKISDAILFGTRRQLDTMIGRMDEQPFLIEPCFQIKQGLELLDRRPVLKIKGQMWEMNRTYIMGVLNLTPDSFYRGSRYLDPGPVIEAARQMEQSGADLIDVGAESTRPGACMTSAQEEIERLKPVLKRVVETVHLPVSVDTYKAEVARYAIDCGASLINDVSGLRSDQAMARLLAGCDVGVVLMHTKGEPRTMQDNPVYDNLMEELHQYFRERLQFAVEQGIDLDRVAIDPGLGFGKRLEDNYTIIRRLREFSVFSRPILVGPSRKSFVGVPFGLPPEERLEGTLGLSAILIEQGCNLLRVHDVLEARRVSQLVDLVMGNRRNGG